MGGNVIRLLRTAEGIAKELSNQTPEEKWIEYDFAQDVCRVDG